MCAFTRASQQLIAPLLFQGGVDREARRGGFLKPFQLKGLKTASARQRTPRGRASVVNQFNHPLSLETLRHGGGLPITKSQRRYLNMTGSLIEEELTKRIIGAAIEVHRYWGPGLVESIYEKSLAVELEKRAIPF
jgi:hypothetical protein